MADMNKSPKIPRALAHDLIDTLAYFKLTEQTRGLLSHCDSRDSLIVSGSNLKLRLDLLALDEDLDLALLEHDANEPSKYFERLLNRFDVLRRTLARADNPRGATAIHWLTVRNYIVRQAALVCIRAQQQDNLLAQAFDWNTLSTDRYMKTIDRLMPEREADVHISDEEHQVTIKQRRNLEDIFVDQRRGISSLKIRTLLAENNLNTFERDMREVSRALDAAVLPKPRIVQNHYAVMEMSGMEELDYVAVAQESSYQSSKLVDDNANARPGKRKAGASHPRRSIPKSAKELSAANDILQQDLLRRPSTVTTAVAVSDHVPDSSRSTRKPTSKACEGGSGGTHAPGDRVTSPRKPRAGKSVITHSSPGEQVKFDDSQSNDESQSTAHSLRNRPTPDKGARLPSPLQPVTQTTKISRVRTPWTEDEVKHLHAAVAAFGKGKWALALRNYKFKDCRTSVDLKDKWRNLCKE